MFSHKKQTHLHTAEQKLKERIKELTCLYDVTSLIVNCDYEEIKDVLYAIADCLQVAWQFNEETYVVLKTPQHTICTKDTAEAYVFLEAPIKIFNSSKGFIKVGYPSPKYTIDDFLFEEQQLLNDVALKVGNLLERKEIKENEAKIRLQVEQSDRLRILGEITAGIAHELNTPLANILGFTELLKESIGENGQSAKDLEKIIMNTIFCREVVKNLMFFACEMPQEKETVNIVSVIEEAIGLMRTTLRQNKVTCNFSFSEAVMLLKIDKIQLTQVVFNLIVNAVYFSPPKSEINVALDTSEKDIILAIADQGSGISDEDAERIFNPFFTTKPLGDGSGLGLSVVHGIVQSHQGTITHRQNKPQGTIFTVKFPKVNT